MPYIKQDRRKALITGMYPENSGELNWQVTDDILQYLSVKGLSYQTINVVVGALEGAKLEFYRRVAIPYEDKKRIENGDVY